MKTAISVPDALFDEAERVSKQLGISRSRLYSTALKSYIKKHRKPGVKESLDSVYASAPSRVDPFLGEMQASTLSKEDW